MAFSFSITLGHMYLCSFVLGAQFRIVRRTHVRHTQGPLSSTAKPFLVNHIYRRARSIDFAVVLKVSTIDSRLPVGGPFFLPSPYRLCRSPLSSTRLLSNSKEGT